MIKFYINFRSIFAILAPKMDQKIVNKLYFGVPSPHKMWCCECGVDTGIDIRERSRESIRMEIILWNLFIYLSMYLPIDLSIYKYMSLSLSISAGPLWATGCEA